jgi:hypothetical protein
MAKKCLNKNYTLNFKEKSKTKKLMQLYSVYFSVFPASEVKPLKFSSNNTMEINLDIRTLAFSKL